MFRRPLAAVLLVGAAALTLTGCLPMPPTLPPQGAGSTVVDGASTEVGEQVTVDDGAGDTWSFAVQGVEENPPMEGGEPEPGTRFVAVLIDAERVEGTFRFVDLFEISAVGTDGSTYRWSDTIDVTAEDDIYYAEGDSFSGARAVIQLPQGVDVDMVVVSSNYGQGVEDTVVDLP